MQNVDTDTPRTSETLSDKLIVIPIKRCEETSNNKTKNSILIMAILILIFIFL